MPICTPLALTKVRYVEAVYRHPVNRKGKEECVHIHHSSLQVIPPFHRHIKTYRYLYRAIWLIQAYRFTKLDSLNCTIHTRCKRVDRLKIKYLKKLDHIYKANSFYFA